jgi:hypothetical protein
MNNNQKAHELLERVLNFGVKANADTIASITVESDVAVLFFEVAKSVAMMLDTSGGTALPARCAAWSKPRPTVRQDSPGPG